MKKIVALLLVLVMALSIVACAPQNETGSGTGENSGSNGTQQGGTNQTPETPVDTGPNADLVLDVNNMGVCNVCGGDPVKWTPISGGEVVGILKEAGNYHYYLEDDNITSGTGEFIATSGQKINVCLHLNNKKCNVRAHIRLAYGAKFNVMGNGTLNFLGNSNTASTNKTMFYVQTASLAIYGGNFISDTGKPIIDTHGTGTPDIKIAGDVNLSSVDITLGTLLIDGNAKIDEIKIGNSTHADKQGAHGKLWVAKTFTGEVKSFTFPGAIADNKVPVDYGAAIGTFTGKITTADGVKLAGSAGALTVAAQ